MSLSINIWKEYEKVYKEYTYEKKWENICILIQIGSFYDILENEKDGKVEELEKISKLLNIVIGGLKNKKENLPLFVGFPKVALSKYLPVLLENGYTVIIMDEVKNETSIQRKVVETFSPSLNNLYSNNEFDDMNSEQELVQDCGLLYLMFDIYLNKKTNKKLVIYGFVYFDIKLNKINIYENMVEINDNDIDNIVDDIKRNQIYNVNEYIIEVRNNKELKKLNKEYFINNFDINVTCHYKETDEEEWKTKNNLQIQKEYFKKIYKNINSVINIIDYLELENVEILRYIIIQLFDFIYNHNEKMLENISKPIFINKNETMNLYMNTLNKLNIISKGKEEKSLFKIINKTQTKIGERTLKENLCRPYINKNVIEKRLYYSDLLKSKINNDKKIISEIEIILKNIQDLEKYYIKILNKKLKPVEWVKIHNTYLQLLKIMKNNILQSVFGDDFITEIKIELDKMIIEYNKIFDVNKMDKQKYINDDGTINNFIKEHQNQLIDCIVIESDELLKDVNIIKTELQNKISIKGDWLKLIINDDKYNFVCTKIRFEALNKTIKNDILIDVKKNTSQCKFSTIELNELSEKLRQNEKKLITLIKEFFNEKQLELYNKYKQLNYKIIEFIKVTDITICNVMLYYKYKYSRPILEDGISKFEAKGIRHPIIEYINKDEEYITNDLNLNNNENGIVLYALNSCGKSSLLRAVGINVILAQCGLYVACEELRLTPFHKIITQVDMNDNIWKSQSSYITEMIGLRTILNVSDEMTLVLSDELTKGTEVVSATSIFASSILELSKRNTKFIFTTHLQDVSKIEQVQKQDKIKIKHLSVIINDSNIVFERKLKDGPTNELYGLEVAKVVGVDLDVMKQAFNIRNNLIGKKKTLINIKKSNYNTKKISSMCEICEYIPVKDTDIQLDTHHINFQQDSDEINFNKHFHKNSKHNLVSLCKKCHNKVHNNEIHISGYKMTLNGLKLIYI